MKKILFITPFAPSNIGAAMKFTKKTIETLAEKFQVDLVYFVAEGEKEYITDKTNIKILKVYRVKSHNRIMSILQRPWMFPTFSVRYRRELKSLLQTWMKQRNYDLIFLDHSQTFIYGKQFPNTPKILMSHDVIFQRIVRINGPLLAKWCHKTEKHLINQHMSDVFSFSTKDKNIIDKEYQISSFVTSGNIDEIALNTLPQEKNNTFVFFGQWVRKDNSEGLEWFLKNVYDMTSETMSFKIIGRGLSEHLQELIKSKDRVEYCGFVDNPYQEIANSRAVLSPLFSGAGVKFKVLESIACGTPVIGTEIAFEGIPAEFSKFMILANNPEEYITHMKSINYSIEECISFRENFIQKYINPYIIKHINKILNE